MPDIGQVVYKYFKTAVLKILRARVRHEQS